MTEFSIEENHIEESTTIPCKARDDLPFSAKAKKGKSTLEVVSKPQIRLKSKARTDEKAQHTR
jgi:hypothetical protein